MTDREAFLAQRRKAEVDAAEALLQWLKAVGAGSILLDDENKRPEHARGYLTTQRPEFDDLFNYVEIPFTDQFFHEVHDLVPLLPSQVQSNVAPKEFPNAYNPAVSVLDLEAWLAANR